MNIIQIGERYVNMDNIVTFKIQFNASSSDWYEFYARTNNGENISIDITEEEANVLKSEFRKKLLLSSEVKKNKSIICVDCRYDFLANIDDCTFIGDNYWCRCPNCRGLNEFKEEEPKDIDMRGDKNENN